jgi:hypothetical protein
MCSLIISKQPCLSLFNALYNLLGGRILAPIPLPDKCCDVACPGHNTLPYLVSILIENINEYRSWSQEAKKALIQSYFEELYEKNKATVFL